MSTAQTVRKCVISVSDTTLKKRVVAINANTKVAFQLIYQRGIMINFSSIYDYLPSATKGDILILAKLDDTIPIEQQPVFRTQTFIFEYYDEGDVWVRYYGKRLCAKLAVSNFHQPIAHILNKHYIKMRKKP